MRQKLIQLGTRMGWVANTPVSQNLPGANISRKWQLRLRGTVTATALAATETYGVRVPFAPATLIQRIDVRVTSTVPGGRAQTIKSISGKDIVLRSPYTRQGIQENIDNAPAGTVSAPGTYTIFGSYDIDFAIPELIETSSISVPVEEPGPDGVPVPVIVDGGALVEEHVFRPHQQTLFDPRAYNPVEIIIHWGDITNLRTGMTAGRLTLTSADITIYSLNLPEEVVVGALRINREIAQETVITGATTDLRADLPRGNFIRQIFIQAFRDGVLDNSILNHVRVVVNEDQFEQDISFNALRNENAKFYRIPFGSLMPGVAIVDFDERRDLTGRLDVRMVNSARISFDVNAPVGPLGASRIRMVIQEITE